MQNQATFKIFNQKINYTAATLSSNLNSFNSYIFILKKMNTYVFYYQLFNANVL